MSGRRDPALDSCPPLFRRHAEEFVVQARSQTAHFAVIDRETDLRVGMIGIHSIDQATGRLMLDTGSHRGLKASRRGNTGAPPPRTTCPNPGDGQISHPQNLAR